jgi:amino-acid N-acetyltransferase
MRKNHWKKWLAAHRAAVINTMITDKAEYFRSAVVALLAAEKLPVDDLPEKLDNFVVALEDEHLVGVAGLEMYGPYGLLRSVAVDRAYRGKGIADRLLKQIESLAEARQLKAVFLLTETAAGYFSRKGYQSISRAEVPEEVQQSTEFSHVCPQSAVVMMKNLNNL